MVDCFLLWGLFLTKSTLKLFRRRICTKERNSIIISTWKCQSCACCDCQIVCVCQLPCCSLCGHRGHLSRTCPKRHCSNCLLPGHTFKKCLDRAYWQKRCYRCGMIGHFDDVSSALCVCVYYVLYSVALCLCVSPGPFLLSLRQTLHRL